MRFLLESHVNFALALVCVVAGTLLGAGTAALLARDKVDNYRITLGAAAASSTVLEYGIWPELARADFFNEVKEEFIRDSASFIEADLEAMTLTVYEKGTSTLRVPIKSKGKEGSWWETPSGLYRAEGKERSHFSSFGRVHMPYSIPFQGNFFIHGWPHYDDGTPVDSRYSGGCIRLEDAYAAQVYERVKVGMPILVHEADAQPEGPSYTLAAPAVSAKRYLVADLANNFVLLAGAPTDTHETQTLPTLLTAVVASEYENIERSVRVEGDVDPDAGFTSGTSYSIYELFFPLLLKSSPDAARSLAAYFGERRFETLLSNKARSLGLRATTFNRAEDGSYHAKTTAEDIFLLLRYLEQNRSFILSMSAGRANTRTYGEPRITGLTPAHPLAEDARFLGGATEQVARSRKDDTAAVMMAFATGTELRAPHDGSLRDGLAVVEVNIGRTRRRLALIVLDSADLAADMNAMLSFAERSYR